MSDIYSEIGNAAGKVYHALEQGGKQTTAQLYKTSGLDDKGMFNYAIGWLAREGKLQFETSGKNIKIFLVTCCV